MRAKEQDNGILLGLPINRTDLACLLAKMTAAQVTRATRAPTHFNGQRVDRSRLIQSKPPAPIPADLGCRREQ